MTNEIARTVGTIADRSMADPADGGLSRRNILLTGTSLATLSMLGVLAPAGKTQAQRQPSASASRKPNILFIMGDDIGWFNISAYNHGIMGYRTPNIDRIAKEGAMFTDWYAQQSCTAGRAAFVTGQSPIRTGLTKVGLPGRGHRLACRRSHRCGCAEIARLCDGAVWQKPSWRQGRVFARPCTVSMSSSAISIT